MYGNILSWQEVTKDVVNQQSCRNSTLSWLVSRQSTFKWNFSPWKPHEEPKSRISTSYGKALSWAKKSMKIQRTRGSLPLTSMHDGSSWNFNSSCTFNSVAGWWNMKESLMFLLTHYFNLNSFLVSYALSRLYEGALLTYANIENA